MGTVKIFMNVDRLADELTQLYKDARNSFSDEDYYAALCDEYDDMVIEERAIDAAYRFNHDMGTYLNCDDHRIDGNFNNIDYDYPCHINGEVEYDHPLVQAMIDRLNANEQSKQANEDRDWLVDWFWETFGSFGVTYNFSEELAERLYELENHEDYGG